MPALQERQENMGTKNHFSHLDKDARKAIEDGVYEGRSLAWIAETIGVDATTVSRELLRNRRDDGYSPSITNRNRCAYRKGCKRRRLCDPDCRKKCPSCTKANCNGLCPDYEKDRCRRTERAPWVCNGCRERNSCACRRCTYSYKLAQQKADSRLRETREGLNMTGHEMAQLAETVKAGLEKGQSVHHIFAAHPELACSERSFYRHVESEAIDVRKMDLHKKVKYKKRKSSQEKRDPVDRAGRTFADFCALGEEERARVVQMDCVEGADGDVQAILTLHFVALRLQIYILLARKDGVHVAGAIDWLESLCGREAFERLFGVILADRGSEFNDFEGIERAGRCRLFYTDPQRSDQKGGCEKNHVELRKIIPKGTSIDELGLDAWLMAGICSHANSSMRLSIGDASPMALAKTALPQSLIEGLGLELIAPDDVETRPELIGRLKEERDDR